MLLSTHKTAAHFQLQLFYIYLSALYAFFSKEEGKPAVSVHLFILTEHYKIIKNLIAYAIYSLSVYFLPCSHNIRKC